MGRDASIAVVAVLIPERTWTGDIAILIIVLSICQSGEIYPTSVHKQFFVVVIINYATDGHINGTTAHTYPKRRQTGVAIK
jgi:hypothetical protein